MARALREAGNEPETLYLAAEQHGIDTLKNRMKYYECVLEFLGKHLK